MKRVAAALALALAGAAAADDEPLPEVSAALARIKDKSTIELSTIGRKTGKEHTRPVWFVVSDGKILLQSGKDGKTDWYRNVEKNPLVRLRQGDYAFRARATPITDPSRRDEIRKLFLEKYTSAWLLSFVGSSIGRGLPVELSVESVAVQR